MATPPPPYIEPCIDRSAGGEQLRRLEQHQEKLKEMQHRQEQERQKRQWLEEERLRLEQLRPVPPQELEWNKKVDMVQQLINQTLMLSGDGGCPPLLLLPVGSGGTLSPLESSMWPNLLPQFSPPAATVTSVSSYSPDSQGSSPPGDWTVVEVETQH
uniref:BTB/POZ domain-containing protein n=1 Tax=Labrus bergylta TaxID=56723 RepID=A0A3Q3N4F5_9LABR